MKLNTIYNESNLDTLARIPDNSVDAIATDPPYGLGREPDPAAMMAACMEEGFQFIGSELDAEHTEIGNMRGLARRSLFSQE